MFDSTDTALFVGHPGHELLVHGWLQRARPFVHVLTDGSGHSSMPRLPLTAELLRAVSASRGSIFGRLSDRQAYRLILDGDVPLLFSIVTELAGELRQRRTKVIVCDAAEGYNPVHDLCRLIVGAAITVAQLDTRQYEYAIVRGPDSFDAVVDDVTYLELDDAAFDAKMDAARGLAPILGDVDELLARNGEEAYRRDSFRLVVDWTMLESDAPPAYERFGEQRVAAQRYKRVIRQADHLLPLRDSLRALVEDRRCAF